MDSDFTVPLPIHQILLLNYEEDITWNFSGRAHQSLFMTIFFHNTISELENIKRTLTTKATDDSKQVQCSNIVFCNKTKPLFVGLR